MESRTQNRSAAGLRRSAVAERIRLREEWSALKGLDAKSNQQKEPRFVTKKIKSKKKHKSLGAQSGLCLRPVNEVQNIKEHVSATSEVLRGVVAVVDVGAEPRALALRAALTALGATVVPSWNPLVTHLIWSQGGCRETRAQARALGSRLVSALWVEGCAAAGRRLPEQAFPAPARASDLPSPRTLRQLLKKYDMENIPLVGLLSDSEENKNTKQLRLRWSSDTSTDKSRDKSGDKTSIENPINTALQRAPPLQLPAKPITQRKKSRRKLFTQKEAASEDSEDNSDDEGPPRTQKKGPGIKLTQREIRDLAHAERIARKLLTACTTKIPTTSSTASSKAPRIVLTGMNNFERQTVSEAVKVLGGRIQSRVNKRTTHVLLGSCMSAATDGNQTSNITGISTCQSSQVIPKTAPLKPRTVNALEGAARGCRVLRAEWATESRLRGRWIYHFGYEVHHLRKIAQKDRVERAALRLHRSEYVYDVFNGLRVRLTEDAEQRNSAKHLLELCGAVLINGEQYNDVTNKDDCQALKSEVTIGVKLGEISSKWVFDSVAAGRMRTKRRYVNISTSIDKQKVVR